MNWQNTRDQLVYRLRRLLGRIQPSARPGLGSIPYPGGVAFRVWAPHADTVFVTGSFNDWSQWRHPLAREENGTHFSADIKESRPGDAYKYVIHYQGQTLLRTDPYARDVGAFQNGIIVDFTQQLNRRDRKGRREKETQEFSAPSAVNPSDFQPPALRDLILYELHVGTFGNTHRDVVGAFAGVVDKLPYLQALGINGIELMPVAEFAGDYSWGYNPGHPFAITRTYGGRSALQALVQAAHQHGIAVLIDVVYNHFGPQELSLWQFDGWSQNGKGGIYFYNDWRSQTPWADTRPDYGRSEVRQYLHDNARMWLDEIEADGLRWDATGQIRNAHGGDADSGGDIPDGWSLMQQINHDIQVNDPGKLSIAEDMQENAALVRPISEGGAGFHAQWDARFAHTLRGALTTPYDEDRDLNAVAEIIGGDYNGDPWRRVIFTASHDEVANGRSRLPEEIDPGHASNFFARKRAALGLAIVMTAPGIPMLFQGQEFLEDGWFDDQDPLDWDKAESNAGFLRLTRDLIKLRQGLPGLKGDQTHVYHINNNDKLLAFRRWQDDDPGVIVIANFANQTHNGYTVGFPRDGIWQVLFNSDRQLYDPGFSNHPCPDVVAAPVLGDKALVGGLDYWGNITIAPYAVLVLAGA